MSQGPPAVAVSHKGRTTIKPKLSLTTRVANNSQKKIETLNRIDDVTLKSVYRFYDLEMVICAAGYKKHSSQLRKQISNYQKSMRESKQREKSTKKTFLTEIPDNKAEEKEETTLRRPKYGVPLNCDPDSIGSVRRSTKHLFTSSLTKSFSDLEKLKIRHNAEHELAIQDLQKMRSKFDIDFDISFNKYLDTSGQNIVQLQALLDMS